MKKMRNSKRGFTLTEMIIVVAIIVIVASAAFVGVAVVLNKARTAQGDLNRTHGTDVDGKELFEAEAWEEIDQITKDAANFFDVSLYKPVHTNTPTATPTPTETPNAGGGGGSTNTPTPTDKPKSTNTNTPTPTTATTNGGGGGGSTTVTYNQTFSAGGGKQTVEVDKNKKIKSISITWKNNAKDTYTAFTVTYNGGGNGNFYNANNTCGVYGATTTTTVFEPKCNNEYLSGCSGINFTPSQGGGFTIESYTIEYA